MVRGRARLAQRRPRRSTRFGVGIRWWMSLVFVVIAAATALLVARVFLAESESAFERHAEDVAVGHAATVAARIGHGGTNVRRALLDANRGSASRIVVTDARGDILASDERGSRSRGPAWRNALAQALAGRRSIRTAGDGAQTVVALPLSGPHAAALVSVTPSSSTTAALGIVRDKILVAALVAFAFAALVGMVVAALIGRRLASVAAAARRIESGDFGAAVEVGFHDEIGELASTVDRMRRRLGASFAALDAERRRLAGLVARLRQGVLVVDAGLRVEFLNACASSVCPGVAVGGSLAACRELVPVVERTLATGEEVVEETVHLAGRECRVSTVPSDHEHRGAIVVLRDITLERRREDAERRFVANASHELRTPITAISNAVEVLECGALDDPDQARRFVAHISRQATRLRGLSAALLTLARAEALGGTAPAEELPVAAVVDDVVDAVTAGPGVDVRIACSPHLTAWANRELCFQALSNLVANALQHAPGGFVEIRAAREGRHVRIDVLDAGPGIAEDERDHVFERFVRGTSASDGGYGLGLAIARQAVRAMAGEIELRGGAGAQFTVSLPATRAAVEAA